MNGDYITVDRNTYESLQQELLELRQAVSSLKQNKLSAPVGYDHKQMSLFLEYIPAAIAIFDLQMCYLSANRRWREDYGLKDQEIIGRSHYEIFPEIPQHWPEIHQKCLKGEFAKCEEDSFHRTDGTIEWIKWEIHPWYQDSNEIGGMIMFTEVITKRKQAEIALLKSEKRLRDIATNLPGAIFQFTNRNNVWAVDYISDFIWELAGITANEMIADFHKFISLVHPEDFNNYLNSVIAAIQNSTPWHYEGRLIKPNGEITWWQGDSTPTTNEKGEIIFCGVLLDITARKTAEAALKKLNEELEHKVEERTTAWRKSEARLQRLADNVPGMMYEFCLSPDEEMSFNYVSSGCRELLELTPEEIQQDGLLVFNYIHPQDIPEIKDRIFQSAQTLDNYEAEWRIKTTSHIKKWVKAIAKPEVQNNGNIVWYGCLFEITKLKQAESKLQEKEEFLRSIYEGITQIIFVLDTMGEDDFSYVGMNRTAEKVTGINEKDLIGKSPRYVHGEIEGQKVINRYKSCIKLGKAITYEENLTIKNQPNWWLTTLHPIKDNDGNIYRIIGTTIDITERKKAEAALQDSQDFIERIANFSPNIIYILDLEEKRNIYANREITNLLGYSLSEIKSMGVNLIPTISHPEDVEKMQAHWQRCMNSADGETLQVEYRIRKANGEWCWLYSRDTVFNRHENGKGKEILGVATDITERKKSEILLQEQAENLKNALRDLKRTQTQLIHSEKMSSLGNMVAGIAHEINNPVNFIHGNLFPAYEYVEDLLSVLNLYQRYFPEPPEEIQEKILDVELEFLKEDLVKLLNSMRVGTDRIREIVLSLRNFSRLDEAEVKEVNIHEGIDSTLMILQNRLKAQPNHPAVSVIRDYGNIPLIKCYPGQMNQVFMNIFSNAIDALEEVKLITKPREIRITTKMINNSRLAIRIADNGSGIPPEILTKLFDPFFTTKDVGKGTGLGLSISYQIIVDKHKGNLYCHSTLGQGTEFVIEIPITQAAKPK
ncbi:PAS domain S-box protein [Okeanomitos corallinicola TIOX110]|uniref:histidine kinase n=1 Tax=Okeanomitos corallinicola TIOX110 TaxID=3133117 RepID=A0ABZ2UUE4_9CYAN